jgi:alpha-1,3-mannosyltransferase
MQALLAIPFLQKNPIGYASRAFELTRQFLFKWTVNWRFIGEEVFLSKSFSTSLLVIHVSLLFLFLTRRWLQPSKSGFWAFIPKFIRGELPTMALSDSFVMKMILTSLTIGLLCARSLHYQFFAYLSWASPFLFWQAGFHPVVGYILWLVQEWAWNVFPSTSKSSMVAVFCLAAQVAGVWLNSTDAFYDRWLGNKDEDRLEDKYPTKDGKGSGPRT